MKILVIDTGLAQDICRVLSEEGHEVLYFINWMKAHPSVEEQMYGKGLFEEWGIERVDNYMKYIKDADLVLFTDVSWGEDIDYLREKGVKVFGASKDGELLENDRLYAKEVLSSVGILVPEYYSFESIPEAIKWLKDSRDMIERQDKRYVIKFSTVRTDLLATYVPVNYQDTLRYLSKAAEEGSEVEVMMEECINGIEVACGAFFNGRKFVRPFNINFEHKRLMPGEIGPNTGEMGTAMFYTFNEDNRIVQDFLKLEEVLREMNYYGYFDLNYMLGVDKKLYGVEATCIYDAKTSVFTSQGWKGVGKIKEGDLVLTHRGRFRKVVGVKRFKSKEVVEISYKYKKIKLTPEHPVLTERGWVKAGELKEDDKVMFKALKCEKCGKLFPDIGFKRRFCSRKCSNEVKNIDFEFRKKVSEGQKRAWRNNNIRREIVRFDEDRLKNDIKSCGDEVERVLSNHAGELDRFVFVPIKIRKYMLKRNRPVYNLQVEEDESFVVKGFVTHNCRFGYPTIMIQECLHKDKLGEIISGVADGSIESFDVLENHWAIGIGVNVAGYPYTVAMEKFGYSSPVYGLDEAIKNGVDVRFAGVIKDERGQYMSCPGEGRILVVNGKGETLSDAIKEAYSGMHYIQVPDAVWRIDIGEKVFVFEDLLRESGVLTEEIKL